MSTIKVIPSAGVTTGGGSYSGPYSGFVAAASDGTITIDIRDLPEAMLGGFVPVYLESRWYSPGSAPAAASAALIVASGALSNGTLTIAANPDVPRQGQAIVNPGTTAISAGTLSLVYVANDGSTTTDKWSLVTAASTNLTLKTSKGIMTVTSGAVAALAGGHTPTLEIGTNATLAVPMSQNAQDTALLKEVTDGADGTLGTITNTGLWAPNTAPNATHLYGVGYSYIAPV